MSKVIGSLALVLAAALGVVLFFWRRSEESWGSMWNSAKSSTSSWSKTASDQVGKVVDRASAAIDQADSKRSDFADELVDAASRGDQGDKTADRVAERASRLIDDAKGATN